MWMIFPRGAGPTGGSRPRAVPANAASPSPISFSRKHSVRFKPELDSAVVEAGRSEPGKVVGESVDLMDRGSLVGERIQPETRDSRRTVERAGKTPDERADGVDITAQRSCMKDGAVEGRVTHKEGRDGGGNRLGGERRGAEGAGNLGRRKSLRDGGTNSVDE